MRLGSQVAGTSACPTRPPTKRLKRRWKRCGALCGGTGSSLAHMNEQFDRELEFETVTVNSLGKVIARKTCKARQSTLDLGNRIKLEMIVIPGGSFLMGSPKSQGYADE